MLQQIVGPTSLEQAGALVLVIPADQTQRAYLTRVSNQPGPLLSHISRHMNEADPLSIDSGSADLGTAARFYVDNWPMSPTNERATRLLSGLAVDFEEIGLVRGDVVITGAPLSVSGRYFSLADNELDPTWEGVVVDVDEAIVAKFNSEIEPVKVVQVPFVAQDLDTLSL